MQTRIDPMQTGSVLTGTIIKAIGGLYTVESPSGVFDFRARGIFRNRGQSPMVGDRVQVKNGVIDQLLPRKNNLIRPPLANLDQLLFVVSMYKPAPNLLLLDKFIAIAEYKQITPILVVTKADLEDPAPLVEIYQKAGIPVYVVEYAIPRTVDAVAACLRGKVSAFTGNSGAGKSTLLNAIDASLQLETGSISEKLGRGRHTTRHAQLYPVQGGGYVADTPGFSTFETNQYDIIRKEELAGCFREFVPYLGQCRFQDCSHTAERNCALRQAVEDGEIPRSRYESYCRMFEEAKGLKEWELKKK